MTLTNTSLLPPFPPLLPPLLLPTPLPLSPYSEAAQENGIVFIMDMRDSLTNDIRFTNSVLSVLKDGYPLHIKMVYLVNIIE